MPRARRRAYPASRFPVPGFRGFTLLELLVALAVFSIVAVLAYGGLNAMMDARAHTRESAQRLGDLQLAVTLMASDLQQTVPRGIRDAYGDPQPPVAGGRVAVELTRGGHANPMESNRATIQRVRWGLDSGDLVRWSWPVLDRTPGSRPAERRLLDGVQALRVEYRAAGEWHDQWPPVRSPVTAPPRAVRFTLELDDWGTVTRVLPMPGGPA